MSNLAFLLVVLFSLSSVALIIGVSLIISGISATGWVVTLIALAVMGISAFLLTLRGD